MSFPTLGTSTVAERHRRLVHADLLSLAHLVQAGVAFPSIDILQETSALVDVIPDFVLIKSSKGDFSIIDGAEKNSLLQLATPLLHLLSPYITSIASTLYTPATVLQRWLLGHPQPWPLSPLPPTLHALAWHPSQLLLAAPSSDDRVLVYDCSETSKAGYASLTVPKLSLKHDIQKQVGTVAWRPHSGATLAISCSGGVCIWHLAPATSPTPGTTRMRYLPGSCGTVTPSCLVWSQDGQLLAGCSPEIPGVIVWDVAAGTACRARHGSAAVRLLRWSACGRYLFGAGMGSTFFLWHLPSWTSASWDTQGGGRVSDAAWGPGPVLLLASETGGLSALHMVGGESAPLTGQVMVVGLPEVEDMARAEISAMSTVKPASISSSIACMTWQPEAGRLAVLLRNPHPHAGLLAIYSTTLDPLLSAHFIGYARVPGVDLNGLERTSLTSTMTGGGSKVVISVRGSSDVINNIQLNLK